MASTTASVSARLERLPMTPIHHMVFLALSFAYFFELGDPNTFAHAAPAIIKAWGIDVGTVALITSASCGGMFLGAVFGGVIADRLGRKRALIYGGFSLVNAAAWDISSLAAARFVTGIGLSAMTAVANTYITGFFPAARRGRFMGLVMTIGLVGIPATAWVSRFVVPLADWGWRLIFLWGGLGILALIYAVIERFERRWFNVAISVYVMVCGILFGISESPIMIMVLGSMIVIGLQAATVSSYTYASELYPTELCAQGNGITYGIGRLANVGGPFLIAAVFAQWGLYGGLCLHGRMLHRPRRRLCAWSVDNRQADRNRQPGVDPRCRPRPVRRSRGIGVIMARPASGRSNNDGRGGRRRDPNIGNHRYKRCQPSSAVPRRCLKFGS